MKEKERIERNCAALARDQRRTFLVQCLWTR